MLGKRPSSRDGHPRGLPSPFAMELAQSGAFFTRTRKIPQPHKAVIGRLGSAISKTDPSLPPQIFSHSLVPSIRRAVQQRAGQDSQRHGWPQRGGAQLPACGGLSCDKGRAPPPPPSLSSPARRPVGPKRRRRRRRLGIAQRTLGLGHSMASAWAAFRGTAGCGSLASAPLRHARGRGRGRGRRRRVSSLPPARRRRRPRPR